MSVDPDAYSEGWGKSMELIDSTPGDLASLGLVAGITFSAAEPEVEVQVNNSNSGLSQYSGCNSRCCTDGWLSRNYGYSDY